MTLRVVKAVRFSQRLVLQEKEICQVASWISTHLGKKENGYDLARCRGDINMYSASPSKKNKCNLNYHMCPNPWLPLINTDAFACQN